jgi:hypothetical protein
VIFTLTVAGVIAAVASANYATSPDVQRPARNCKRRYVPSETALGRNGPFGAASAAGVIVVRSLLIVCRGG